MAMAAALAGQLRAGDVIALEGPLGSGKTCFVRGLAKGLGIDPSAVSSPTFVICQEYEGKKSKTKNPKSSITLVHIDAYRVNGPDELETIGWSELPQAPDAIIAIEWPSRIGSALPAKRIDVTFAHEGERARSIAIAIAGDQARPELLQAVNSVAGGLDQEKSRKSKGIGYGKSK